MGILETLWGQHTCQRRTSIAPPQSGAHDLDQTRHGQDFDSLARTWVSSCDDKFAPRLILALAFTALVAPPADAANALTIPEVEAASGLKGVATRI